MSGANYKSFEKIFLWALGFAVAVFFFRYLSEATVQGKGIAEDFEVFYRTAKNLVSSEVAPYYYNPQGDEYYPYLYPPYFLFMLYPLAWMDYQVALAVWCTWQIMFFLLAARYYLSGFELPEEKNRSWKFILLASPFIVMTMLSGQMGLFTSGLFLLGFALLDRKPVLAGVVFALISFKPQLAVLLPLIFIARRSWLALFSSGVMVALLFAASVAVYGIGIWADFLNALQLHAEVTKTLPEKMLTQMVSIYIGLRMAGVADYLAMLLHVCVAFAVVVYIYRLFSRKEGRPELAYFVLLFLVSPYVFMYDLPVMAVTLFVIMAVRLNISAGRMALMVGSFMPLIGTQLQAGGFPVLPLMLVFVALMIPGLKLEKSSD